MENYINAILLTVALVLLIAAVVLVTIQWSYLGTVNAAFIDQYHTDCHWVHAPEYGGDVMVCVPANGGE